MASLDRILRSFAPAYSAARAQTVQSRQVEQARADRLAAQDLAQDNLREDRRIRAEAARLEAARLEAARKESERRWDLGETARKEKIIREQAVANRLKAKGLEDIRGRLAETGIPQQQEGFKIRGGFPMEGLEPGVEARTLTPTPEQSAGLTRGELVQAQMRATALQEEVNKIAADERIAARATPSAAMSPGQRRIKDLLKIKYPDATDQELANYELAHWERKGLSPTDKGITDITKVQSAWRKASAAIDAKLAKGEKPTPEEMDKFWDYEFEIHTYFGKMGRKIPPAIKETMKKVWRFPTAVVEEEVLGAQDVAIQAEQLVADLDYLVKEFGQDQLNKHVGLWDKPLDDFRKTLGIAAGSKHFKALQSFKQVYQGILNETLKLRSGAAVTPSEWERFQKEIGVPTSADFYDRLRTFALKSRRAAKQRLQTRLKARYIFSDEIQKEVMEGLAPFKPKEEGEIPELPQGKPEEVEPVTPMPTPPRKLSAAESVEIETLVNKGVKKLTPAEKIKLKDLLLIRQRNK